MKKIYILSILSISFLFSLSSKADYWTQKADFPGFKRTLPISFSIGNLGYVGWGTDTQNMSVKDLWAYNVSTNTWTQKATLPGVNNARSGAACFANSTSGKAYAGLGQNTLGTLFADWWEYNSATNTWASKAAFPGGARSLAVGFFTGLYGYVGMGSGLSGDFNDLYLYEPVSNTWIAKPSLPSAYGRREVASFVIGSKGYVACGYSTAASSSLLDLYEWDSSTDTWTQKNSLYGDARYGAVGFTCWGSGFVGIGKTVLNVYATDFWQYEPYNDVWYQKANFGGAGRFEGAAFAINDSGYVGLGGDPGHFYKDLWKYTPDTITGINQIAKYNVQFSIYPNPVKELLIISYSQNVKANVELTITDIHGKRVYHAILTTADFGLSTKIDVGNFSNGIYLVTSDNGKQKTTRKFLKE
jgi:N-acetylneuraminic acid mutarotase